MRTNQFFWSGQFVVWGGSLTATTWWLLLASCLSFVTYSCLLSWNMLIIIQCCHFKRKCCHFKRELNNLIEKRKTFLENKCSAPNCSKWLYYLGKKVYRHFYRLSKTLLLMVMSSIMKLNISFNHPWLLTSALTKFACDPGIAILSMSLLYAILNFLIKIHWLLPND